MLEAGGSTESVQVVVSFKGNDVSTPAKPATQWGVAAVQFVGAESDSSCRLLSLSREREACRPEGSVAAQGLLERGSRSKPLSVHVVGPQAHVLRHPHSGEQRVRSITHTVERPVSSSWRIDGSRKC